MEKLNKQMDDALNTKVAALNATDDETGDGKVDALDLKHQLDRVEAQLELQDQQNRALLRSQKRLLWAAIAIVVVLCLIMGGLLLRFNTAYNEVIITCAQVNDCRHLAGQPCQAGHRTAGQHDADPARHCR